MRVSQRFPQHRIVARSSWCSFWRRVKIQTRLTIVHRAKYVLFAVNNVVSGKSSTLWRMYLLHSPMSISRGCSLGISRIMAPSSSVSGVKRASLDAAKQISSREAAPVKGEGSCPNEARRSTRHQLVGVSVPKPKTRNSCFVNVLFRRHRYTARHGPMADDVLSKGDIGVDHSR